MFESFFGFSANPFQLNPDPSFFFESKGHRKAYAFLQYGLFQGEGFIVITGEIGAGKTTLVRALLGHIDPKSVVAAQLVSTQLDADDLLRAVAISFGLPVKDAGKAELLAGLEAFLTSLVPQRRRALLVVDEAQNLTSRAMEELRMLSNFQIGDRALLQSFLIGQPELRDLMRTASMQQLRQRIIASYHLGPMEPDETRAYVEHRLKHVGWKGDPSIDAQVYPALHEATAGIPRRINSLCNRLLLGAYLAGEHRIDVAKVEAAIAELRDELGEELGGAQVPSQNGETAGVPGNRPPVEGEPAWGSVRPLVLASIAARIDRIERKLDTVLVAVQDAVRGAPAVQDRAPRSGASRRPRA
ncbi:Putative fused protein UDP-N-acetylglucosamine 2-epimerase: transport, ATPase component (fragment) [Burkholderiales bacterium]